MKKINAALFKKNNLRTRFAEALVITLSLTMGSLSGQQVSVFATTDSTVSGSTTASAESSISSVSSSSSLSSSPVVSAPDVSSSESTIVSGASSASETSTNTSVSSSSAVSTAPQTASTSLSEQAPATKAETPQGPWIADNRYITIIRNDYPVYSNFNWQRKDHSSNILGKTFQVRGHYNHSNGQVYYSLYDGTGTWRGYINSTATKVASGQQGTWQAKTGYVSVTQNYPIWWSFNFGAHKYLTQRTLRVNGMYHHLNGSTYYSVYNGADQWQGYINANAVKFTNQQGAWQQKTGYVSVVKDYPIWWSFNFGAHKYLNQRTLRVNGMYHHLNGSVYYSVYNSSNQWQGYINASATKSAAQQGIWGNKSGDIRITKKNYSIWRSFSWQAAHNTNSYYNQVLHYKGVYNHYNGQTYYSLYTKGGQWLGYLNKTATGTAKINTHGKTCPYPWGECTYYVWHHTNWAGGYWGNGSEWDSSAKKDGYTVDHNPTKGSIMVCERGQWVGSATWGWRASPYGGHVGLVQSVKGNTVTITQGGNGWATPLGPNTQTVVSAKSFQYIHS